MNLTSYLSRLLFFATSHAFSRLLSFRLIFFLVYIFFFRFFVQIILLTPFIPLTSITQKFFPEMSCPFFFLIIEKNIIFLWTPKIYSMEKRCRMEAFHYFISTFFLMFLLLLRLFSQDFVYTRK